MPTSRTHSLQPEAARPSKMMFEGADPVLALSYVIWPTEAVVEAQGGRER